MAAGPMMRCNRASDEIYGNRAGDEIYGHRPIAAMLAMPAKLCCLRLAATAAPRRRHPTGVRPEPNHAMDEVYGKRASDKNFMAAGLDTDTDPLSRPGSSNAHSCRLEQGHNRR